MTSNSIDPYYGLPPMPVTDITLEQEFKLKRMEDLLQHCPPKQMIELFLDLQKTNFILTNNISQLLLEWPTILPLTTPEDQSKSGTSSEINN
jgi:hypothetical protein